MMFSIFSLQHNNTTSDDIFICEAYLVFLNGGGDNAAYWKHLNDNGITRERMESFERPILSEPEDFHWMRGALIGEFAVLNFPSNEPPLDLMFPSAGPV